MCIGHDVVFNLVIVEYSVTNESTNVIVLM